MGDVKKGGSKCVLPGLVRLDFDKKGPPKRNGLSIFCTQ